MIRVERGGERYNFLDNEPHQSHRVIEEAFVNAN
jgi:hypothetical protein